MPAAKNLFKDQVSVRTTDATVTTIRTIPIPSPVGASTNSAAQITARIVGVRTGGSAGAAGDTGAYFIVGCVKNTSGTAALVGTPSKLQASEDQIGWDVSITVSGANALLRVTGATNNNITWTAFVEWTVTI